MPDSVYHVLKYVEQYSPATSIQACNGPLARVFLTLLDTELKRTDAISGWNPSPVGLGRAEPKGIEWGRMEPTERLAMGMRGLYFRLDAMFQPAEKTRASRPLL